MTTFQRIRITIDMNTVCFEGTAMSELAIVLRGIAKRAEEDGLLGWSQIEDSLNTVCGELQIQTIEGENDAT